MFWGNKRREDPPDSVSVFGSVGFWLLEPGLVASNRDPHPTYGTGPKKGNEVHFKPSVLVQWDLSRTTFQFGPLTAILLAWILGSRVLFQSGERLGRRVPWRPPRSHVPNQNDQILQWQTNLLPSCQMQNHYLYQRSFIIRATRTWNSLPTTLRSPDINIRQFKTDLQTYYLKALRVVRECFNEEDPRSWKTICLKCNTSRYLRYKLTCCF